MVFKAHLAHPKTAEKCAPSDCVGELRSAYQEIRIIRKVCFAFSGRRRGRVRPRPVNIGRNAHWPETRHPSAFADFPDNIVALTPHYQQHAKVVMLPLSAQTSQKQAKAVQIDNDEDKKLRPELTALRPHSRNIIRKSSINNVRISKRNGTI